MRRGGQARGIDDATVSRPMHLVRSVLRCGWRATLAFALVGLSFGGEARAVEPDVARARAAYDQGTRAYAAKDYATAARHFAEADALAPTAASLEAALEAAMRADDAPLGAELVDRSAGRALDASLARTLETARQRFGGRVGKIRVDCKGAASCVVSVDGVASEARRLVYVRAGAHDVVVQRGEERFQRLAVVPADGVLDVAGPAVVAGAGGTGALGQRTSPSPSPSTSTSTSTGSERSSGASPTWVWIGAGVTAVVGGLATASALDASALHRRYDRGGCAPGSSGARSPDCDHVASDGSAAQTRTNVLIGATAVIAVATVATAIFLVRWKDGTTARMNVGASARVAAVSFEVLTP
ncbi:MAG: hypothetical protein JWM74_1402 [Myxococcaceae bacterium]|nr:hypothetical protein [Myxococcaceae bacterium]